MSATRRRLRRAAKQNTQRLHCPRCFCYRAHWHTLTGSFEYFTCCTCANVQYYTR